MSISFEFILTIQLDFILRSVEFYGILLTLIVTTVHVTFDITFRMLESRKDKNDKKKK